MAVLQQPTNHSNPFSQVIGDALAPAGTYIATVLDIKDEFGVTRQKFESTELEKVDLTCFLFGFRDAQGSPHRVASRQMRISGNEKSALFGFLKSLLGRAPAYGWDFCSLKGHKCLLTVEHVQKRDGSGVFASIAALSPVPAGFGQLPQPVTPAPVAPVPAPAAPVQPAWPAPVPVALPTPPPAAAPAITANDEESVPF